MFKRFLITLALGMASTGFAASSLPTDSKFDSVVTLKTGNTADDLSMVLRALGSSVGLTVVVEGIPAKSINYDISGKPFRDVWDLLIQLNGLDYEFKSNNIVVVGPPSVIAGIRKPAVVPQVATATPAPLERRFYNLNGSSVELVAFLSKEVPKAVINAVGTSKIIAVTGTAQEQGEIATLLSRVDPAPVNQPVKPVEVVKPVPTERRVFTVNGTVADVVAFLKGEYPKAGINAIGSSKTVAVTATSDELDEITELLEQVDPVAVAVEAPVAPPVVAVPTSRVLYSANGNPEDVQAFILKEFPQVSVSNVKGSKTLVINATEQQQKEIVTLLTQVDPVPPPPVEVVLPPLPPVPEPIPTSRVLYTINGNVSEIVSFLSKELPKVSLNPVGGNSKVVALTGTAEEQAQAKALLVTVDPPVAAAPVTTPQLLERQTYLTNGNAVDLATLVSTEFPGVVATTLGKEKSNILVVRAPSSVQGQIKSFLEQVDPVPVVATGPVILQKVFQLSNTTAEDAKKTLEGTLSRPTVSDGNQGTITSVPVSNTVNNTNFSTSTTTQGAQPGTNAPGAAGAATSNITIDGKVATVAAPSVTIIADPKSNSLIVRGTQGQIAQIAELLTTIDKRLPRLNVNVRVQEISESAARTLGIDWSAGIGNFVVKAITSGASSGLSAILDPTRSLSGSNIGAALNALESQGVARRVDDSNLTLISGQLTATELNSGGNLTLRIGDGSVLTLPYGVIIKLIEPRVDSDGKITVQVDASVKNPPVITNGGNTIDISNRQAKTSISFNSGESVLLGGLLTNRDTNTSTGIPFLSSIPIIGEAFKSSSITTERTQLLLVITGTIIQ
jgi:type IV pilus assembly protein PilQ